MSDVQLIQEKRVSFGATGEAARSEEVYIKILASFKHLLPTLKNGRLNVFMAIATHEADVIIHNLPPLSTTAIEKTVDLSRPTVLRATEWLRDHNFIEVAGKAKDGTYQYRVKSCAWFGTRGAAAFHPADDADVPAFPHDLPTESGGKNILPPPSESDLDATPSSSGKKILPAREKIFTHDDDCTLSAFQPDSHHHDLRADAKKILFDAGFRGKRLDELTERLSVADAGVVAAWVQAARAVPEQYAQPYGYAYAVVMHDGASALPSIDVPVVNVPLPVPAAEVFGVGVAGEMWRDVALILRDQLDAESFAWMLAARVVDYEQTDAEVCFAVFDAHGCLNRVQAAIAQTLTGMTGKRCTLEFVRDEERQ